VSSQGVPPTGGTLCLGTVYRGDTVPRHGVPPLRYSAPRHGVLPQGGYSMRRHGVPPSGGYSMPRHRVTAGILCLGMVYPLRWYSIIRHRVPVVHCA